MLILDIFALHAMTDEGKLQVELAQLQYSAPRLSLSLIHIYNGYSIIGNVKSILKYRPSANIFEVIEEIGRAHV